MIHATHELTAGLVFLEDRRLDIVRIGNQAAATLGWLDSPVLRQSTQSDQYIELGCAGFDLTLRIETEHRLKGLEQPAALYLAVTITRDDAVADADAAPGPAKDNEDWQTLSILAHLMRSLHLSLVADHVQWMHPEALLSRAEFESAIVSPGDKSHRASQAGTRPIHPTRPTRPRIMRRRRARHLPDVELTNQVLQNRFDTDPGDAPQGQPPIPPDLRAVFRAEPDGAPHEMPSKDIREETAALRLTVWMMTFILALFALPVAAGLAMINLLRGENLRLASQTAALTGLFTSLHVTGATAQALSTVQTLM